MQCHDTMSHAMTYMATHAAWMEPVFEYAPLNIILMAYTLPATGASGCTHLSKAQGGGAWYAFEQRAPPKCVLVSVCREYALCSKHGPFVPLAQQAVNPKVSGRQV